MLQRYVLHSFFVSEVFVNAKIEFVLTRLQGRNNNYILENVVTLDIGRAIINPRIRNRHEFPPSDKIAGNQTMGCRIKLT